MSSPETYRVGILDRRTGAVSICSGRPIANLTAAMNIAAVEFNSELIRARSRGDFALCILSSDSGLFATMSSFGAWTLEKL